MKKTSVLLFLLTILLLITGASSASTIGPSFTYQDNTNKNWKATYVDPWYISSASDKKGTFVAGSREGIIAVTKDYNTWNLIDAANDSINSIAYGKDRFVTCGPNGQIMYSKDGYTWKKVNTKFKSYLYSVTWTGSQFIITGEKGLFLKSSDGSVWNSLSKKESTLLQYNTNGKIFMNTKPTYKNNKISGFDILISGDTKKWGKVISYDGYACEKVLVAKGKFYILSRNINIKNKYRIIIFDGRTSEFKDFNKYIPDFYFENNKLFCFVYGNYKDFFSVMEYSDGVNWVSHPVDIEEKHAKVVSQISTTLPKLTSLQYDGKKYSFVGNWGVIYTSLDGVDWTSVRPAISSVHSDIIWDGSKFIAVSFDGSFRYSDDGITWYYSTSVSDYALNSICYNGKGKYIALNTYNYLSSTDGTTWEEHSSLFNLHLTKVIYDGDRFILLGSERSNSKAVISTISKEDEYETVSKGLCQYPRDIAWDGQKYIIIGENTLQYSEDCINWVTKTTKYNIMALAYGNGTYIGVGAKNNEFTILTSNNGLDWTEIKDKTVKLPYSSSSYTDPVARWTGNEFILTTGNAAFVSKTGASWKEIFPTKDNITLEFKTCISNDKMYIIPAIHSIYKKLK